MSITQSDICSVVTNSLHHMHSMYMRVHAQTPRCGVHTDPQIQAWFQARDIIGKMASNNGEVSGASSVFCGPVLGKVQTFC